MFRLVLFVVPLIFVLAACDEAQEVAEQDLASTSTAATATVIPTSLTSFPSVSSPTGTTFFGWGDVTLLVPNRPDIYAGTAQILPAKSGEGRGIQIIRDTNPADNSFSHVLIDAATGGIVEENVLPEDRQAIDEVLSTIKVTPFDPISAPWPFNGDPPEESRKTFGNLSYLTPPPEARLQIGGSLNDPGGSMAVSIGNGRSSLVVGLDPQTNGLLPEFHGDEVERPPFERWLATVRVCVSEDKC